ncbi:MAG: ribonuclease R [Candidatus Zixiibacteriota bacterium]
MPLDDKTILRFIASSSDRPMKLKEMARALEIGVEEYPPFRKAVKRLIESGELVVLKRNRIGLAGQLNVAVGTISVSRGGTGFVAREGKEVDLLIPATGLGTAMDGDKVMVRLSGQVTGRDAAVVIKVLERAPRKIVGLFRVGKMFSYVVPDNPRIHRDIYIHPERTLGAEEGVKVVARLVSWEDPYLNPEGEILEILGRPGDPGVDMLTVIRGFDLPESFPPDVLEEAERAAAEFHGIDITERLDLTRECIYTIDPENAKDHDDAVSVAKSAGGYQLGVHIADVSHFVKEGTALDTEAFTRGNSVYLPGMVIPMLPEVLSNDVCSLKPDRKRLAHSIFIDYDAKGKMLSWRLADSVINSQAKLSYEEVQQFFDTRAVTPKIVPVAENLLLARELADLLSKRRFAEGSLDFDLPEAKIIMNEKGEVLELGHRVRLEAHRLIEEFMLAANRAVALEVFRNSQPFLYRVHDRPDLEKLEAFSYMVSRLGYKFAVSPTMRPGQFARFLKEIEGVPEEEFINELMLRSMQKAVYQQQNIGHFGLAFSHYTHFTSPIRRYPDLIVHRLLRKLRHGKYPPAFARRVGSVIDHVGTHCSETERTAEAAERQAIKVKQVAFMARHLGDEYSGIISGVTSYGFFVRLDNLGVEGMVRISAIDDDYYTYDETNYRIIGRRKKRTFRLGDAIRVGVMNVNTTRNEVDLFVVGAGVAAKPGVTAPRAKEKKPSPKKKFSQKRTSARQGRRKRQ